MTPLPEAPHALVTGAAGAIGGALARELRRRRPRARLTLVDLDAAQVEAASPGGETRAVACDLALLDALPGLVAAAEGAHGGVDVLVSCAGVMDVRSVTAMPWARVEALLAVDLLAPLRLQQLCAKGMLERRRGWIANVTSMAGRVPLKGCAYYGAAKAGLAMASEVARAELAPSGVVVVTVYPGPVASALERGARAQYRDGLAARALPTGQPAEVARRVVSALERGRPRVVYPAAYELGFRLPGLAARVALGIGPDPAE